MKFFHSVCCWIEWVKHEIDSLVRYTTNWNKIVYILKFPHGNLHLLIHLWKLAVLVFLLDSEFGFTWSWQRWLRLRWCQWDCYRTEDQGNKEECAKMEAEASNDGQTRLGREGMVNREGWFICCRNLKWRLV